MVVRFEDLTPEQWDALRAIKEWFESTSREPFRFGGLAGTGKTALLPLIPQYLGLSSEQVLYVAPTNQAVKVIAEKLDEADYKAKIRTLHSAFKRVKEFHCRNCPLYEDVRRECHVGLNDNKCGCDLVFNTRETAERPRLIICDESSMVTEDLFDDMTRLPGNPKILYVGDHGQLPPPDSSGFDLMANPDIELTEPLRQKKDSPIIKLSRRARNGEDIGNGTYGPGVFKSTFVEADFSGFDEASTIMLSMFAKEMPPDRSTGRPNYNCLDLNRIWRSSVLGFSGKPKVGDRVRAIRVNRRHEISKGTMGTIVDLAYRYGYYQAEIRIPGRSKLYQADISEDQFERPDEIIGARHLDLWEYGYCITCNKAQGSEFESVIVFEPPPYFRTTPRFGYSRWLYTAITRAKANLAIISW